MRGGPVRPPARLSSSTGDGRVDGLRALRSPARPRASGRKGSKPAFPPSPLSDVHVGGRDGTAADDDDDDDGQPNDRPTVRLLPRLRTRRWRGGGGKLDESPCCPTAPPSEIDFRARARVHPVTPPGPSFPPILLVPTVVTWALWPSWLAKHHLSRRAGSLLRSRGTRPWRPERTRRRRRGSSICPWEARAEGGGEEDRGSASGRGRKEGAHTAARPSVRCQVEGGGGLTGGRRNARRSPPGQGGLPKHEPTRTEPLAFRAPPAQAGPLP